MNPCELPTWLTQSSLEDLFERPRIGKELRTVIRDLHAGVWHSTTKLHLMGQAGTPDLIKVFARTLALQVGTVITVVIFGLQRPLPERSKSVRKLIEAYASSFNGEKWRRTRWFLAEAGDLVELKLHSHRDRRVWLLQEFDVQ